MPYIYDSSASVAAGVSDNLQPILVPPVSRYFYPRGADTKGGSNNGIMEKHIPFQGVAYIPFKMASTITADRVGMATADLGGITDIWYYDLALYTHNATDNYPSTKITNFGTITWDPATMGAGNALITINQTLQANTTYWLGVGVRTNAAYPGADILASRTVISPCLTGDFQMFRKRGMSSVGTVTPGLCWVEQIPSYNGTMPASTQFSNAQTSFSTFPRFAFRRSA